MAAVLLYYYLYFFSQVWQIVHLLYSSQQYFRMNLLRRLRFMNVDTVPAAPSTIFSHDMLLLLLRR